MTKKSIIQAALATVILFDFSGSYAASNEIAEFGSSTIKNISPVATKSGECMSFEASFSKPLDQNPSVMLDIEQHFINMFNQFLEVTKISEKKYRLTLVASTTESCPNIEDGSRLTISTYNGSEKQNALQTLPSSTTFEAEKTNKKIILKKQ